MSRSIGPRPRSVAGSLLSPRRVSAHEFAPRNPSTTDPSTTKRWLPKGVEVLQHGVGLADDGSGEEAPGEGTEGDAPHAVPAADEDAGRLGGADEGVPVGGDGASADPFLLALVPVDALEDGAGGVDEQRDAPGV